ncbi:RED protein N-terminal region-domain-containing protein [Salix suchowensis]|nr:RED protein N-terminal region-domain-containing protein [Salix suchowensis]
MDQVSAIRSQSWMPLSNLTKESFRRLLETSRKSGDGARPGARPKSISKHKTVDASQPAFQPRKVKKASNAEYRIELPSGGEERERLRSVYEVEEQRKYLGGDGDHSILVKGLDFALLEQNKARATHSTEDDDSLEVAFAEASTIEQVADASQTVDGSKKRTRADLLRELKEKREASGTREKGITPADEVKKLEQAKKAGKFKPIGLKPIGDAEEKMKRKKFTKDGEDRERKKKKRKVEQHNKEITTSAPTAQSANSERAKSLESTTPSQPPAPVVAVAPQEELLLDDFDIFEGVGEYEGIDLGDDDEEGEHHASPRPGEEPPVPVRPGGWFVSEDGFAAPLLPIVEAVPLGHQGEAEEDGEVEEAPMRLQPLESSALPSIKDFLAMDEAAGKDAKRRKRKEKKKAGGGGGGGGEGEGSTMTAEARAERDYKRPSDLFQSRRTERSTEYSNEQRSVRLQHDLRSVSVRYGRRL